MNAPDRFELFLLNEALGEKKITEKPFAGMSNTSDFIIMKEDHTIGNLLSEHFKQHLHVQMAAYKVAHPNVPEVLIRLQTDGTMTPKEVFVEVCKQLIAQLSTFSQNFTREFELRKMATEGDNEKSKEGGANGRP
ncbi:DNA-directed RNA polymerase II subunit RPB11 [Hypoxylon fuscum]|nr:DNA-directed RNA polymerase II subunit RPB11 [Hypoxylon fuscum]